MSYQINRRLLALGVIITAIVSVIGVAQAVTPLEYGETISGSIDPSTEIDTYTFSAYSNDTVIIRVDGPSASNDLNPEIRLYAPNGTLLTSQWNYNNLEMQHTLPDNGEYIISVFDHNIEYTGSYNLFIQRLNNPSNTTPIGFGEMVSDSIDTSPEVDTYTFSADSNDTVIIRVDGPSASNDLNPEIRLYAPNGTLLTSQWSYNNLEMQHTLPDNGEYNILVLDYNIEYNGSYNLFIQRLNNPSNSTPIGFGETVSDSIDTSPEIDIHTFSAYSNDTVIIRVDGPSASNDLNPEIRLYAPNGTLLTSQWNSNNLEIQHTLPDNGEYNISVLDYNIEYTGSYNLFIQRLNNPSNTTPIGFGETVSDSIDTSPEIDIHTFSAYSNDTVIIRVDGPSASNELNPKIRLYAPNGTLLTSQWNYNNLEMQHTLPDNGEYNILVLDYKIEYTGSYNLFIQRLNNPSNTTPIGFGETVSDSIDTSPEVDTYTFSADSNDTVIIRVDGPSASNELNPKIRLYAPNGTLLTSQWSYNNLEMQHTLPDNGEYNISVLDYNIEYTGSYNLFIQRLNNPSNTTPIGFGETVSDSIDTSPEIDIHTFSAYSNDTVIIRVDGPSATNDLNPEIRLYAPNGTLLTSKWNYNNLEMQHTLPDNGEYNILVLDYNIEYTGSYNLFIQRLNNPGLAPFANFTYSPKNPVVNQVIIFNATASYDPDGIIINYEWDFGDGNITSTTEKIITHSYTLEGDYDVNLTITDNSNTTNSTTRYVQVVPIGITIDLYTGWNLISLPLMPEETSIAFVLSPINGNYSIIWEYNASDTSDHWKKYDPGVPFGNDLTNMEPGKGYWILMTSDNTLPIIGTVPESTDMVLKTGWNLIGYNSLDSQPVAEALSSISGNYSIVWTYNASDTADHWKKYDPSVPFGNDLTIVEPGKGYWIMMTSYDILEI